MNRQGFCLDQSQRNAQRKDSFHILFIDCWIFCIRSFEICRHTCRKSKTSVLYFCRIWRNDSSKKLNCFCIWSGRSFTDKQSNRTRSMNTKSCHSACFQYGLKNRMNDFLFKRIFKTSSTTWSWRYGQQYPHTFHFVIFLYGIHHSDTSQKWSMIRREHKCSWISCRQNVASSTRCCSELSFCSI